jgi:prevent-host-death family protein
MRYEILLAPEAIEDLKNLKAAVRAAVRDAIEQHLRPQPAKESKSRIKRLRGLSHPQYRLRVGDDIRVFYDVTEQTVHVLEVVAKSEADKWLGKQGRAMKQVALSELKDDLSKYLRLAEREEIIITRHGKPAGVLVGFASEDDWFDYRLEHDPRFLRRITRAKKHLQAGKGVKLEDLEI